MKHELIIQNLKCGGCKNTIVTQLLKINGIRSVEVDEANNRVEMNLDIPYSEIDQVIVSTLNKLGYPPIFEGNNLLRKSKSFLSCAIGKMSNNSEVK